MYTITEQNKNRITNQISVTNRNIIFYLPHIKIENEIVLDNIKLVPLVKSSSSTKLLKDDLFEINGTLIEATNFKCGGNFNVEDYKKINKIITTATEILKFSYFAKCLTTGLDFPGFLSESTFDMFRIISQNEDTSFSFEQKIQISNGMSTYLMKLDDYYRSRYLIGKESYLALGESNISYYNLYKDLKDDDNKLLIMRLYNKCRKIYTEYDYLDRVVLARTSIESLIKEKNLDKKNYVGEFFKKIQLIIEQKISSQSLLLEYYKNNVKPVLEISKTNLNKYLEALAKARHNLVHEGKEDAIFDNISAYFVFFPIFFTVFYCQEKINEDFAIRSILFLHLLSINPYEWNKVELINLKEGKRNLLSTYAFTAQALPKRLELGCENAKYYLQGFENAINEAKQENLTAQ